jgi:hypothetical protein
MSELSRWKEYRIRQAIYLESLKQNRWTSNQVGAGGENTEVGHTSLKWWREGKPGFPGGRRDWNRTKHRWSAVLLRSGLLAGGAAICLWLWWIELGFHR